MSLRAADAVFRVLSELSIKFTVYSPSAVTMKTLLLIVLLGAWLAPAAAQEVFRVVVKDRLTGQPL
jgi:hypothetical protein